MTPRERAKALASKLFLYCSSDCKGRKEDDEIGWIELAIQQAVEEEAKLNFLSRVPDQIKKIQEEAIAQERSRCAKIVEAEEKRWGVGMRRHKNLHTLAAAIREGK